MELQPHWELCQFIQKNWGHDLLILLPRGTFKSSVISVALPLWLFTKNRNLRILHSGFDLSKTKGWLALGRQHLEQNQRFRRLYGDWVNKNGIWHSTAISLAGREVRRAENSWTVTSVRTTETSQHHDVAIVDDPHTDKNLSREAVDDVERYSGLLAPILDPQAYLGGRRGPQVWVGTHWAFDDAYARIRYSERQRRKRGEPPRWRILVRKAITRQGKLFFPTRFTKEFLDEVRSGSGMTRYLFSCLYLNDPQPEEDQVFKLRDMGFFHSTERVMQGEVSPMPKILNYFSTCDPSLGETEEADWCAIVTNGMDSDWNFYCWNVVRDHFVGNDAIIEAMFVERERWKPLRFGVESTAFQKSLVWGFRKTARERGKWFHVVELEPSSKVRKNMRIQGFEPFITGHRFYLRVKEGTDLTQKPQDLYYALVEGQDVLADEMLRFPLAATKDVIDAQAYMPQLVFPAGVEPEKPPDPNSFEVLRQRVKAARTRRKGLLSIR